MPNKPEPITVELTLIRADDAGIAYGLLCHIWHYVGITYIWDLGVGRGTAATPERISRTPITFLFAFDDIQYKLTPNDSNAAALELTRNGKTTTLTLDRTERREAPCISRVGISPTVELQARH